MLYGMSPFNTEGKIDKEKENQYLAAKQEVNIIAQQKYPIKAQNYTVAERNELRKKYPNVSPIDLYKVEHPNFKAHTEFVNAETKKLKKQFPYVIYPPSNEAANRKYRELEIMWLNYGGNVDTFNAAVKEGATKSPRNKTFNYLLGKFAAKTYKTKDLGLAIRAVVGAALGGDRFSWTDKDIFNPWVKKFGSGNISGAIGTDPGTAAGAAAGAAGSAPWWVPILTKLCYAIIAMLPALFGLWSSRDDNPPAQVGGGGGNGGGGNDTSNLTQYALPIGAAVALYLLFFSDDKKD
jgi:hypothetical protein